MRCDDVTSLLGTFSELDTLLKNTKFAFLLLSNGWEASVPQDGSVVVLSWTERMIMLCKAGRLGW